MVGCLPLSRAVGKDTNLGVTSLFSRVGASQNGVSSSPAKQSQL